MLPKWFLRSPAGTFSKETGAAAAVAMAMGATDARLGALAANGRPSQTPATGTEMTDWVTLASWKCAGN